MSRPRPFLAPLLLVVLSAIVETPIVLGYPTEPTPLWNLVQRSDVIVLADVVQVAQVPRGDSDVAVADLHVQEVWKGDVGVQVAVVFSPRMECPAPPVYLPGRTVLAFLFKSDDEWLTSANSYGVRYPDAAAVTVLRQRVSEAIKLQAHPPVSQTTRLEWLTKAAANPVTRWDAAVELVSGAERGHSYFEASQRNLLLAAALTPQQRHVIAEAFVARPVPDDTLPLMLVILASYKSREVDLAALSAIEALDSEEDVTVSFSDALVLVLKRFGDEDAGERLYQRELESPTWPAVLHDFWHDAKRALDLPAVRPTHLRPPTPGSVDDTRPR